MKKNYEKQNDEAMNLKEIFSLLVIANTVCVYPIRSSVFSSEHKRFFNIG